jgi:hypothetical protein
VDRTTRPRRHPARRTRRAVGAASVAGVAAFGGAVAVGTDAAAMTPATLAIDQAAAGPATSSPSPEWRRAGPIAGSSGAAAPDASSRGS